MVTGGPEKNKDTKKVSASGNGKDKDKHTPRPVKPEDESYRELMMRFTAHPVKPKYWFEEFGDHWTCSCGQINKGETCANCGLERDLLRKLFILHKPSADGTPAGPGGKPGASQGLGDKKDQGLDDLEGGDAADAALTDGAASGRYEDADDADVAATGGAHKGLVIGVIIAAVLLLMGTGAFLYYVVLPEMQAQDAAKRDSVRISLTENLPIATAPLPKAQYKAYVAAGDMLCKDKKFVKAQNYYKRAADLKDDASIKQKILDAKYGYVKSHQSEGGEYFETYLNELVDKGYDGARTIYDQYYAWHVSIVANNMSDDFTTDMKNVNRSDTVYFHTTVTGGAPGDAVRLYYQIVWPDGSAEKKDIDSTWKAGTHFSTRFQYSMPFLAKAGKLTFEIYDKDSHDLLGTDSIRLMK